MLHNSLSPQFLRTTVACYPQQGCTDMEHSSLTEQGEAKAPDLKAGTFSYQSCPVLCHPEKMNMLLENGIAHKMA